MAGRDMDEQPQTWTEEILAGDRRAIGRALSVVENGGAGGLELLKKLYPKAGRAYVVGVTGSPGVGKSTLVEKLAAAYRREGKRVGIVAVDPSSPFSGGAILGDRIRMQSLFGDDGVYIRSMATRGHLGGLALAAHDVVTILDAAGCDVVLVETVGVGQDEVEIARHADVTVLLLVPGLGDDVQIFKAGVMEIADLYVINKADRAGAERAEREVTALLAGATRRDGWSPPVLKTVATKGEGVEELHEALGRFRSFSCQSSLRRERQHEQLRMRLLEALRQRLLESALEHLPQDVINAAVEDLAEHRRDPHSVAEELIARFQAARA